MWSINYSGHFSWSQIRMLSDMKGEFTKATNMELDSTALLGNVRSRRWVWYSISWQTAVAENNVHMNMLRIMLLRVQYQVWNVAVWHIYVNVSGAWSNGLITCYYMCFLLSATSSLFMIMSCSMSVMSQKTLDFRVYCVFNGWNQRIWMKPIGRVLRTSSISHHHEQPSWILNALPRVC